MTLLPVVDAVRAGGSGVSDRCKTSQLVCTVQEAKGIESLPAQEWGGVINSHLSAMTAESPRLKREGSIEMNFGATWPLISL